MTERRIGNRTQLIIWAAAEARRRRRQAAPVEETVFPPAITSGDLDGEGRVTEVRTVVLDWQLAVEPSESGAARAASG